MMLSEPKSLDESIRIAIREESNENHKPWGAIHEPSRQRSTNTVAAFHAKDGNDELSQKMSNLVDMMQTVLEKKDRPPSYRRKPPPPGRNRRTPDGRPVCNYCDKAGKHRKHRKTKDGGLVTVERIVNPSEIEDWW